MPNAIPLSPNMNMSGFTPLSPNMNIPQFENSNNNILYKINELEQKIKNLEEKINKLEQQESTQNKYDYKTSMHMM